MKRGATMTVGGYPPASSGEGGEAMELLEVIGLISLIIMTLDLGFRLGNKNK